LLPRLNELAGRITDRPAGNSQTRRAASGSRNRTAKSLAAASEQGTAVIWGHDAPGQTEQVIGQVAHPPAREHLREAAASLGLRA
jgi:hypothetical protein